MEVVFVVDSGSDYSPDLLDIKHQIQVVPLNIHFGENIFRDGVDLTKEEFYQMMSTSSDLPKTSQPSPQAFYDVFKEILDQGKKIVSLSIPAKLSGTYQSAHIAKDMFSEEEQKNIFLIDTESVSVGIMYLLKKADEFLSLGQSVEKVIQWIEEAKKKISIFALLDTLENLKKGGRISTAQAFIGELLNIKPLIILKEGVVENLGKFRGRKKGLKALSEKIASLEFLDKSMLFVAHSFDSVDKAIEELKEIVDPAMFGDVYYVKLGSTLGTHAGENTMGVCIIEQ